LEHPDGARRSGALSRLHEIALGSGKDSREAADALVTATKSSFEDTRRRALLALAGTQHYGKAVPALVRACEDRDPGMREFGYHLTQGMMGRCHGTRKIVPYLGDMLASGDESIRGLAVWNLVGVKQVDEDVLLLLRKAAVDSSERVRNCAIEGLAHQTKARARARNILIAVAVAMALPAFLAARELMRACRKCRSKKGV
jgi:HEAT repeat protein